MINMQKKTITGGESLGKNCEADAFNHKNCNLGGILIEKTREDKIIYFIDFGNDYYYVWMCK